MDKRRSKARNLVRRLGLAPIFAFGMLSTLASYDSGFGYLFSDPEPFNTPPQISDLWLERYSAEVGEGDGWALVELRLSFIDPNWDVADVDVNVSPPGSGDLVNLPEPPGTTSGEIITTLRISTSVVGEFEVEVWVTDELFAESNRLTATFTILGSPLLSSLSLSVGDLDQPFDSATTDYTATADFASESTTVTFTTRDPGASASIDGQPEEPGAVSAPIPLAFGETVISLQVTSSSGDEQATYVITVGRGVGARLSDLSISAGPLDQTFQPDLSAYTASVEHEVSSTTVTGVTEDPNASLVINGTPAVSGLASEPIALEEGFNTITIDVTAEGGAADAAYTIDIVRDTIVVQEAYIKASNTDAGDRFGQFLALDGETLVIGAPDESSASAGVSGTQDDNSLSDSGAVYVFTRNVGGIWTQQAYIKASTPGPSDEFGHAVAIDNDTLAVAAPFEDSAATGVNGIQTDDSATNSGAVYIFVRDAGGIWSQQAYLKPSNTGASDFFGWAIHLSGDTLVVGAFGESSAAIGVDGDEEDDSAPGAGAVYVFSRDVGGNWSQQAYIKSSNTGQGDGFGRSVSVDGDTLVVAASGEDSNATGINGDQHNDDALGAGAAYVFVRDMNDLWSQQAYLKASNAGFADNFGSDVSIHSDVVVVGAVFEASNATGINGDQNNDDASGSGAAYVFDRDMNGSWVQQAYLKASNEGGHFGHKVAVNDGALIVGAPRESGLSTGVQGDQAQSFFTTASGAVYFFNYVDPDGWMQLAYIKSSNTQESDQFGGALDIDTGTIAVGAHGEDGAATGVDGNQIDNTAPSAGAVYVFR